MQAALSVIFGVAWVAGLVSGVRCNFLWNRWCGILEREAGMPRVRFGLDPRSRLILLRRYADVFRATTALPGEGVRLQLRRTKFVLLAAIGAGLLSAFMAVFG